MSFESQYYDLLQRIAEDQGLDPLSEDEMDWLLWNHTGFPFATDEEIVEGVLRFFADDLTVEE